MKNFFKKLAFVLALAMVVTAIAPAAKASAATEPAFKYTGKKLYIGGDLTGTYEDTYRFTFTNAKGYKATWKSSNPEVATIDAKNGEIQAIAVGKTTITATLKKAGSKTVVTEATVWVKQNAEKVGFGAMASVKNMAVGDTGKVNVYRQVGDAKIWKQSEKTVVTDTIVWTSSDESVAKVDKWGKVTAVAAGTAKITATATQSEGNAAGASKSYTVTVKAGLLSATQASKNTINAVFAGDLSAVVTKDNVKVYQVEGATKVNVVVKEVKFDKTDKTKATITTFADFAKDKEYVVEYADTTASFKGVDLSREAVSRIEITTKDAVKGEASPIEVVAYTESGVVVPASVVDSYIELTAETSSDYYLNTTDKTITFFNSGKSATVKAIYHTYTYGTDYKEITKDATATIVSKDVAAVTIKTVDAFTVYNTADPDFTKSSSTISVSDNGSYKVAVKATNSLDKEVKSTTDSKFTFASSDETTLIVNGTTLYPVKEGGAVVMVYYDKTVVGAYAVTIGAKRVASDVSATLNKTTLNLDALTGDSIKLTVKTKDQFGVDRTGEDAVTVTFVSGPSGVTKFEPTATGSKKNEFTFDATNFTVEGNYQYKVTVDNQVRYVSFTAKKAGKDVANYQLTEAGKTVDTALKVGADNKTDSKLFTMSLDSYTSAGYKVEDVNIDVLGTSKTEGDVYAEVVAPKNADVSTWVKLVSGSIVVDPIAVSGGAFVKAPTGTYTVKVFENVKNTKGEVVAKALTVTSFTITDTQAVPTVVINKTTSAYGTAKEALQHDDDVVTIKFGDDEYNHAVIDVEVIGKDSKKVAVTKAFIEVDVNYNGNTTPKFIQEVAIGATITLQ